MCRWPLITLVQCRHAIGKKVAIFYANWAKFGRAGMADKALWEFLSVLTSYGTRALQLFQLLRSVDSEF